MIGRITDIKEFGVHDGPGLITTVFLKGCPLKCVWCHNPETQSYEKELMVKYNLCEDCGLCRKECNHEDCKKYKRCIHICPNNCLSICGKDISAKDLANKILRNSKVLTGVTFSGGEPLMQADFLLETISYLNNFEINIETSGYCDSETFKKVIESVDLVYFDIKLINDSLHKKYTGISNDLILKNFKILQDSNTKYIVRTPLISGITDTKENIDAIKKLIGDSSHELLPYNDMASLKYKMLNREYLFNKKR